MSSSAGKRLAVFAVILAGTFAAAYAIGDQLPGNNRSPRGAVVTDTTNPAHTGHADRHDG